ncbi:MAG: ester cyclase [Sandaracinobacter sp.]
MLAEAKRLRLTLPLIGAGDWRRRAGADFAADICAPIDRLDGVDALESGLLVPLAKAFPHGEDRLDILIAGRFRDQLWTASTGHIAGLFEAPLFGIPATSFPAFLRYARFERWDGGQVAELILLLDLPDLMMQAGCWPLAAPMGNRLLVPGPSTRDGYIDGEGDSLQAAASLKAVEDMIAGLMRYDGKSLSSMGMVNHWHPRFWWFGPAPIGSFCGHADYERGHQGPFLKAFPDRVGGNHRSRIGERAYVASTGWPSIRATHLGGGFLGQPPTGKPITMRVMDFWRAEDGRLKENWVFIDLLDLCRQLDLDILARMQGRAPAPPRA